MEILHIKIPLKEIIEKYLTYFETMSKAVVDIKKEIMAITMRRWESKIRVFAKK